MALKQAGYAWAKPLTSKPVISCAKGGIGWDPKTNDSDLIDYHTYSGNFAANNNYIYSVPGESALVTESGCRWYRTSTHDTGSPIAVINWLSALQRTNTSAPPRLVPGAMLAWCVLAWWDNNNNDRCLC